MENMNINPANGEFQELIENSQEIKKDAKKRNPRNFKNANGENLEDAIKKDASIKDAKKDAKGKEKKSDALNLSAFFESEGELRKEGREGNKKGNYLYLYAENNLPISKINFPEGKEFRRKRRGELKKFSDRLFNASLSKNQSLMIEICKEFIANYKKFYAKNDFSLSSINGGKDLSESDKRDLMKLLEISAKINSSK